MFFFEELRSYGVLFEELRSYEVKEKFLEHSEKRQMTFWVVKGVKVKCLVGIIYLLAFGFFTFHFSFFT